MINQPLLSLPEHVSGGIRFCNLKDDFIYSVTVSSGCKIFTSESVQCLTDLPLLPSCNLQPFLGEVVFTYFFQKSFRFFQTFVLLILCLQLIIQCHHEHIFHNVIHLQIVFCHLADLLFLLHQPYHKTSVIATPTVQLFHFYRSGWFFAFFSFPDAFSSLVSGVFTGSPIANSSVTYSCSFAPKFRSIWFRIL